MIVWIVSTDPMFHDANIVGIFSSQEKAETAKKKYEEFSGYKFIIEEWGVE